MIQDAMTVSLVPQCVPSLRPRGGWGGHQVAAWAPSGSVFLSWTEPALTVGAKSADFPPPSSFFTRPPHLPTPPPSSKTNPPLPSRPLLIASGSVACLALFELPPASSSLLYYCGRAAERLRRP
eukprot:6007862-Pyramimonas_sp.AAC.1